ncbi:MAG: hypothetical protein ACRDNI_01595 [Gaiellaceae bacterium]
MAVVYLVLGTAWIYGLLDTGVLEDRERLMWMCIALFGLGHVAFGFAYGRWIGLLLPNLLIVLAIPAGYPESSYEPLPLWYWQLFLAPFLTTLVAVGLGARALRGWSRRSRSRPRDSNDPAQARLRRA